MHALGLPQRLPSLQEALLGLSVVHLLRDFFLNRPQRGQGVFPRPTLWPLSRLLRNHHYWRSRLFQLSGDFDLFGGGESRCLRLLGVDRAVSGIEDAVGDGLAGVSVAGV